MCGKLTLTYKVLLLIQMGQLSHGSKSTKACWNVGQTFLELTCEPAVETITLLSGIWGHSNSANCNSPITCVTNMTNTDLQPLQTECDGHQSCRVQMTPKTVGACGPGDYNYQEVFYSCRNETTGSTTLGLTWSTPQSNSTGIPETKHTGLDGGAIAGIVIFVLCLIGAGLFAVYWFWWRKREEKDPSPTFSNNTYDYGGDIHSNNKPKEITPAPVHPQYENHDLPSGPGYYNLPGDVKTDPHTDIKPTSNNQPKPVPVIGLPYLDSTTNKDIDENQINMHLYDLLENQYSLNKNTPPPTDNCEKDHNNYEEVAVPSIEFPVTSHQQDSPTEIQSKGSDQEVEGYAKVNKKKQTPNPLTEGLKENACDKDSSALPNRQSELTYETTLAENIIYS